VIVLQDYKASSRTSDYRVIYVHQSVHKAVQEAQLMLTTGSTRLAVSRGQET